MPVGRNCAYNILFKNNIIVVALSGPQSRPQFERATGSSVILICNQLSYWYPDWGRLAPQGGRATERPPGHNGRQTALRRQIHTGVVGYSLLHLLRSASAIARKFCFQNAPERYGGFCRQSKPHGLSAFCFQCDLYVSGMERPSAYAATKSRSRNGPGPSRTTAHASRP